MAAFEDAERLLRKFKGDGYLHGIGVLPQVGRAAAELGHRAVLVRDAFPGSEPFVNIIKESLSVAGVMLAGEVDGARPNAPREDLARITDALGALAPDVLVTFGGGSTIDAVKAADVLRTLGGAVDAYFGVGMVTGALKASGARAA